MGTNYEHLNAEERATIMLMQGEGCSLRAMARRLHRAPSTISRELERNSEEACSYDARRAGVRARALRRKPRRTPKLAPHTVLFGVVEHYLREGWSPEQIAGTLKRTWPHDRERTVSHETIYNALYVMPRGELRTELIACLRQGRGGRRPRARGEDRRGQIPDMARLQARPDEVDDRLVPGHWEGDLIKGAANRSAVGTLVERSSRLVMLARMEGSTAQAALADFTEALNRVHEPMRKTLTYDQGKEMSRHRELTEQTGVKVYFADPHSPWQRGSNENTNGLLRQYLPKGTDLSGFTQDDLDAIAFKLNSRPRKIHGFRSPLEVYAELLVKAQNHGSNSIFSTVALGS
ncbi:MAG TPA: IS30 family transposase [Nitrospira sp.]|nr:IS30 family transposase [Nitrospira sp.]